MVVATLAVVFIPGQLEESPVPTLANPLGRCHVRALRGEATGPA